MGMGAAGTRAFACMVLALSLSSSPGSAGAAQLPGGVGSLVETFEDWIVACRAQNGVVGCVLRQEQSDSATGRPMLAAELRPRAGGRIDGALLLPFGLKLADGAGLSTSDAAPVQRFAFSTCVPDGCIVPVRFDQALVNAMKEAPALKIEALTLASGEALPMRLSLKGFSEALARATQLAP
ncbi:invasion associated locus B family protein [Rhizobium sp. CSW-27]|uniref:invasion associated locus B family protein n=1 Tax=Rhizobium sp. CSW-27 TaxID=2839985 RepID=UPI001C024D03|nr:invasion associated locus B family protein [Rhizobium sp. CSW-27]MBT9370505.1 invasion associated locus B family protein [Rhizobium sp. CSW-27]